MRSSTHRSALDSSNLESKVFKKLLTVSCSRPYVTSMTASLTPFIWCLFILNLLLQAFDGLLTYYFLSLGVPEWNPLVHRTITLWGTGWGLLYWKMLAGFLLLIIFALRHRRPALIRKALTLTATVYSCFSVLGVYELFLVL